MNGQFFCLTGHRGFFVLAFSVSFYVVPVNMQFSRDDCRSKLSKAVFRIGPELWVPCFDDAKLQQGKLSSNYIFKNFWKLYSYWHFSLPVLDILQRTGAYVTLNEFFCYICKTKFWRFCVEWSYKGIDGVNEMLSQNHCCWIEVKGVWTDISRVVSYYRKVVCRMNGNRLISFPC